MNLPDPSAVTRTAILGTGLIGASWAALFLSRGLHVHAIDPAESAETRLRDTVTEMWPSLVALGHADAPPDFAKLTGSVAQNG